MAASESLICRPLDQQKQYGHLWQEEAAEYEYSNEDLDTVECAELAEELALHEILAFEDDLYEVELAEWWAHVYEHELMLPLEQSCHEGVLLPVDQRAVRLESCPEEMLRPLRWFFELCPVHVKSRIALDAYLLIRMNRARRTGNPDWSPKTAQAKPEPHAFFTAPKLKFRNYAR
ncbi:MAG: hypothetical protein Q8K21_17300 [Hydrogenophaga sp.]|uniref:hypothetical protein n=1 Tax=Hydrogenophaga sp. TaxID=1904254 RepID=UPI002730977E|nr:hypothetical protein [Hydrogenophaga sp.]MDP2165938.1 hypothetical protein [Hydrogenophaga sp.]MDP3476181.1 hypothetical protein [Hydrogenophaga sp.]